ncbi:MAG: divalent-cation tolerance protein CutA [Anaerolineales bacterium]|nr:divalent-cation tolerance protein CutA [Anaerolineales bacterium]
MPRASKSSRSPVITSGKVEAHQEPEFLLLIKSRRSAYAAIETFLRSHHSYTTPEILWLPVEAGLEDYLNWMRENTRAG